MDGGPGEVPGAPSPRLNAEGLPILYLYAENAYAASYGKLRNVKPSVLRPQTWHNVVELWVDETK